MIYKKDGEIKVALSEDEVERSIACLSDLKEALETNERTKHNKEAIQHIQIAIETMMAFCMEHFEYEDE